MKKPEPSPVMICWPCACCGKFGMFGMPNWRKNFCIGLVVAELLLIAASAAGGLSPPCSILTRTEITAGFTLVDQIGKAGRRLHRLDRVRRRRR